MSDYQHFVPRFYLQGFLDPLSVESRKIEPYLWVADIENKVIKKKAPKNIAGFQNYYDFHAEPFQNQRKIIDRSLTAFETQAAPIIHRIRNNQFQISIEERFRLANFIGVQLGRVPIFRKHIDANLEKAPLMWLQDYVKDEKKLKQRFGKDAEWFKEYVLSSKLNFQPKFLNEAHRKDFIVSMSIKLGLEFAQLIFGMRWMFLLTTNIDKSFFASDNPARLMSPNAKPLKIKFGELNEELEISIPISPKCVLWMHSHDINQNTNIGYNEAIEVDKNKVDQINWSILPTIDKYAFCSNEKQASWIIEQSVLRNPTK